MPNPVHTYIRYDFKILLTSFLNEPQADSYAQLNYFKYYYTLPTISQFFAYRLMNEVQFYIIQICLGHLFAIILNIEQN